LKAPFKNTIPNMNSMHTAYTNSWEVCPTLEPKSKQKFHLFVMCILIERGELCVCVCVCVCVCAMRNAIQCNPTTCQYVSFCFVLSIDFAWPGGFPSHVNAQFPGSIHEGG
jgi:hypothetical protein